MESSVEQPDAKISGTELAPMSTTTDLMVAIKYSAPGASQTSILLQIDSTTFFDRGADISFLSAFPAEKEFLYPPLTYFENQPRRKPFTVETVNREGGKDCFRVIPVIARMPDR